MAIPRPALLALLGLVLCAAAFVATRGAGDSGNVGPTATPVAPAPAHKAHKAVPAHKSASKPAAKPVAKPAPTAASVEQVKLQRAVTALQRGDVVVFFFSRPGAADDTATRQAVQSLAGLRHLTVVPAGLDELALYQPVLQGAGVTQVPALVIAHGNAGARVLQGYVDANTLRQNVADARR